MFSFSKTRKSGEKVKVNKNGIEYTGTMTELPFI